ncbi:HlyD family secretion protein [Novosphingobium lindaniclasticum]|uniref:Multidrug resistance protein MdtA-like barrel-sandwich hybrid domain-containing protein n=1 Tax=Novosphingobium lindaniclasticum LE124 TaxID=1096930 RepID=T0H641_9SPHN|nr:biotin/lipoyl-binding protein [Novosphingobium lindaniclasticum]EQB07603.1 hypothetical protein L284_22355 [Novosphingobium lindaniclasticum LE124]
MSHPSAAIQSPAVLAPPSDVWQAPRSNPITTAILTAVLIASVGIILRVWGLGPFADPSVRSDDALVRGRTVIVSPQVSGYVRKVPVKDYDTVRRGQLLALIDDDIYRAKVLQAQANLDVQLSALANSEQQQQSRRASIAGQTARMASASAQLVKAKADMARALDLAADGSISMRERDQTAAALATAEGVLRETFSGGEIARQDLKTVLVGRSGLKAQVEMARAELRLAEIDLLHTVIRAPETGQLGEVRVREGAYVTNGTSLMEVVPPLRYIIAQYKEALTYRMAIGQRVTFTVDALGGHRMTGRVSGIAPATGWEFAVLKPDNATGNFVKIPQRIGVMVQIDKNQPLAERLRPGMSVETRIEVAK